MSSVVRSCASDPEIGPRYSVGVRMCLQAGERPRQRGYSSPVLDPGSSRWRYVRIALAAWRGCRQEAEPTPQPAEDEPRFYWPSLTHFHSPVPDTRVLSQPANRARIWPEKPPQRPGLDWRGEQQLALLRELAQQPPMRIPEQQSDDPLEYFAPNPSFGYYDSWALSAMLRHLRPARMIETGSGWTSLLAARVNREYLNGEMDVTCIDPYPQDFVSAGIEGITRVVRQPVEQTPLTQFTQLARGDVLFIDGTHTVKTGGDVVYLFGDVIPRLRPGVFVHVHDVFLPRDYPEKWVLSGWGWNEQYLVQAFLAFNPEFEIVLAMAWLALNHPDAVADAAPSPTQVPRRSEASLWFRRRGSESG
jgi:Methyltransferase domain